MTNPSSELDAAQSAGTAYPLDASGQVLTPDSRARRQFAKGALGTLAALALGWLGWTKYLFPAGTQPPQEKKNVKSGGVKLGAASGFAPDAPPKVITLDAAPGQESAAYVVQNVGGQFHVLSAKCTHQGCNVDWSPKDKCLLCPCHGAQFDADGKVLKGPAKTPLPVFASHVEGGTLFVEG